MSLNTVNNSNRGLYFKNPSEDAVIVAVEGDDEIWAVSALGKHLKISPNRFHVINYSNDATQAGGGKEKSWLKKSHPLRTQSPLLAVICDAEDSAKETIEIWHAAFKENNLPIPESPEMIYPSDDQDIHATALFVSPFGKMENSEKGCLEDAFLKSCKSDEHLKCSERFLECCGTPENKNGNALQRWKSKFLAQSMAKTSRKPGMTFGQSLFKKAIWDLDSPSLDPLRKFLILIDKYNDQHKDSGSLT